MKTSLWVNGSVFNEDCKQLCIPVDLVYDFGIVVHHPVYGNRIITREDVISLQLDDVVYKRTLLFDVKQETI